MIIAFIDSLRANGFAVESICRVLSDQGCTIAARTYRAWRSRTPAARSVSDAHVIDAVRDLVCCPSLKMQTMPSRVLPMTLMQKGPGRGSGRGPSAVR